MNKLICIFGIVGSLSALGALFRNLGFEAAITNNLSPGTSRGRADELVPAWEFLSGSFRLESVGFNDLGPLGGGGTLTIIDRNWWAVLAVGVGDPTLIDGTYALYYETQPPATQPAPSGTEPLDTVQRGDIPAEAKFLSYKYRFGSFRVTINGTPIAPFDEFVDPINVIRNGDDAMAAGIVPIDRLFDPPPANQGPRTAFFDISEFAGQNVELRLSPTLSGGFDQNYLDSIQFHVPGKITSIVNHDYYRLLSGTNHVEITFAPPPMGKNIVVEFLDDLASTNHWQVLPGGPHNSGSVIDFTTSSTRFYRLRFTEP